MANITAEQIKKANEKLHNGFVFDPYYYMAHKQKTAAQYIELQPGVYAYLRLTFYPEYIKVTNEYGCTCNMPTGNSIPACHVTKKFKRGNMLESYGLGKWVKVGEPQKKKTFSTLQEASKNIDIKKMIAIAQCEPNALEESKALFL